MWHYLIIRALEHGLYEISHSLTAEVPATQNNFKASFNWNKNSNRETVQKNTPSMERRKIS